MPGVLMLCCIIAFILCLLTSCNTSNTVQGNDKTQTFRNVMHVYIG